MSKENIMTVGRITKRYKKETKYIAKMISQGRWVWNDMHRRSHDSVAILLGVIKRNSDKIKRLKAAIEKREAIIESQQNQIIKYLSQCDSCGKYVPHNQLETAPFCDDIVCPECRVNDLLSEEES